MPLTLLLAASHAFGQIPANPIMDPEKRVPWHVAAKRLLDNGRFTEATQILEFRLQIDPKDTEALFLSGLVAMAKSEFGQAVKIFRAILIDHPDATRVRLELGRAFYEDGDYDNATRQFHFALAGDLPPEVVRNVNQYLSSIRQQKIWSYGGTLSLAPDTNLNTGSSAREVTIYGLPFDLSEDAQQKSGVGIALQANGELAPRIGPNTRLRLGIAGSRREYSGTEFDDTTIALHAGPRLTQGKWDISLLATGYRRWYGGRTYHDALGARAEATYYLTPRLGLNAMLSLQHLDFPNHPYMTGDLYTLGGSFVYALTQSSGVAVKTGGSRQTAADPSYANHSAYVAAGYFRDLPMGFSTYVEPSYSFANYDEAISGFARKREDRTASVIVTLLNRHIILDRFTPRISYSFVHQDSSISLYQFQRHRLEMGLTTAF